MSITIRKTVKKSGISDAVLKSVIEKTLKKIKKTGYSVSLSIIGEQGIRSINRDYRGIDLVTDVLSFPADQEFSAGEKELGDVFICPNKIKRQAKEFDVTFREEMIRMVVHGILHLDGYDHIKQKDADIMFPLQEKIVASLRT